MEERHVQFKAIQEELNGLHHPDVHVENVLDWLYNKTKALITHDTLSVSFKGDKSVYALEASLAEIYIHLRTITALKTKKTPQDLDEILFEIFEVKNAAYGDSFKEHGPIGCLIRLWDKMKRINTLKQDIHHPDDFTRYTAIESLEDTLMDAVNYVILSLICIRHS